MLHKGGDLVRRHVPHDCAVGRKFHLQRRVIDCLVEVRIDFADDGVGRAERRWQVSRGLSWATLRDKSRLSRGR